MKRSSSWCLSAGCRRQQGSSRKGRQTDRVSHRPAAIDSRKADIRSESLASRDGGLRTESLEPSLIDVALAALDVDDVLVVTRPDTLGPDLLDARALASRRGKALCSTGCGARLVPAAVTVPRGGHGRCGVAAESGA
jgi:hypothetical protein